MSHCDLKNCIFANGSFWFDTIELLKLHSKEKRLNFDEKLTSASAFQDKAWENQLLVERKCRCGKIIINLNCYRRFVKKSIFKII